MRRPRGGVQEVLVVRRQALELGTGPEGRRSLGAALTLLRPARAGRRARRYAVVVLAVGLVLVPALARSQPRPVPGECSPAGPVQRCLFRSAVPSVGLVSVCEETRCRVGFYYGSVDAPEWLPRPEGWTTFPPPEVTWHSSTFAEVRFGCGPSCSVSYFFDGRRRRLSPPRRDVRALDQRRMLVASPEGRALVVRQVYSGREVARIERDFAPGLEAAAAVREARFHPDGRLSFVWLRGAARDPVAERVSVPSMPR